LRFARDEPSLVCGHGHPALDSFQDVLFFTAHFRETTGAYTTRITVVGHDFKRRRFEKRHLRWPKLRFTYIGIIVMSVVKVVDDFEREVNSNNEQ